MQKLHYIEVHKNHGGSLDQQIAKVMMHWQTRFELGAALLLCPEPHTAIKSVRKHWRRLTLQYQKDRENQVSAAEILLTTRRISRMQRVKFTAQNPDGTSSGPTLHVLSPDQLKQIPSPCFTVYVIGQITNTEIFEQLSADALIVSTQNDVKKLPLTADKSELEEKVFQEENALLSWLKEQDIDLASLVSNMELTNEALDTLLSSSILQNEFLIRSKTFFFQLKLAQPLKLSDVQEEQISTLEQLEHHVKVLSPSYISDSIFDNQSEESFLLQDILNKENAHDIAMLIEMHREKGHQYIVAALQEKFGFKQLTNK